MAGDNHRSEAAPASSLLLRLLDGAVRLGGALATALILAGLALTLYAVFMRYVADRPLLWSDQLTGWALVAIVMLGTAEAHRRGDHISIDLLTGRLVKAWRWQQAWANFGGLVFALIIGWSAWHSIDFARGFGSYTTGNIEIGSWIPMYPLVVGSSLLALSTATRMVRRLLGKPVR